VRHQFHQCPHLRVFSVDASEFRGDRRGGKATLEELCDAKQLTRCLGLVECDLLPLSQKRGLLATRAARMRAEEGVTPLSGAADGRRAALVELRNELLKKRDQIVLNNRKIEAEIASLSQIVGGSEITDDVERARASESIRLDDALEKLRIRQLDAIDRALDAIALGTYDFRSFRMRVSARAAPEAPPAPDRAGPLQSV
jgi:RNA polymerase-binding transcription factor DksA